MARLTSAEIARTEEEEALIAMMTLYRNTMVVFRFYLLIISLKKYSRPELSPNPNLYQAQLDAVNRLTNGNDNDCHEQLRVNRQTFFRLCCLVRGVRLGNSRFVCVEERVAMFLWIVSHHTKQRRTKNYFRRSIETISRHFKAVLQAVLRLHSMLLVTAPEPVPANYHDNRWNWFQVQHA